MGLFHSHREPIVDVFDYTGAEDVWHKPIGARTVIVELIGGGGGGGGAHATGATERAVGSGGCGGDYLRKVFSAGELDAVVPLGVGPGGAGGAGFSDGAAGGYSYFGDATWPARPRANGGGGGLKGTNSSGNLSNPGGAPVVLPIPLTFDVWISGDPGSTAILVAGAVAAYGDGGRGPLGGRAVTAANQSPGQDGDTYPGWLGGGGSGACSGLSDPARGGGDGAPGRIIVTVLP